MNWYRFTPDEGPATSFNAESKSDAQRFAAEHFHGVPGILRGPLVIEPLSAARCSCGHPDPYHC